MTKLQLLHRALNERLMAAVEQIMEMVGGTVLEYEEETIRARKENEVLRRRLRWMEGANRADWPGSSEPISVSTTDETNPSREVGVGNFGFGPESEALVIKTEATELPLCSMTTLPQSIDQGPDNAGTGVAFGLVDSMTWDSAQNYMAPLDFDPTSGPSRVRHWRSQNKRQRMSFACPDCGKVFGNKQRLMVHMRIHSTERPYAYRRRKACFYGDNKKKMKLHRLSQLSRDIVDDLSDGSEQMNRSSASPETTAPVHEEEPESDHTSSDKETEKRMTSPVRNRREKKTVENQMCRCPHCPHRVFARPCQLAMHMKTHTVSELVNLPSQAQSQTQEIVDAKRTSPKRQRKIELKKKTKVISKNFRCPDCGKVYFHASRLSVHMKSHKTKTALIQTAQQIKTELTKEETVEAVPTQTEEQNVKKVKKTYACPHCDKVFSREGWMIPHIRTHHGEGKNKSDYFNVYVRGRTRSQQLITKRLQKRKAQKEAAKKMRLNSQYNKASRKDKTKRRQMSEFNLVVDLPTFTNEEDEESIDVPILGTDQAEESVNLPELGTDEAQQNADLPETATSENAKDISDSVISSSKDNPKTGFQCQKCGKIFVVEKLLKKHGRKHLGYQKNWKSKADETVIKEQEQTKWEEEKRLDDQMSTSNHTPNVTQTPHGSPKKDSLRKSRDRGQGPLPCPFCGKVFAWEMRLLMHMQIHCGEKPYAYRQRKKRFYGDLKRGQLPKIHDQEPSGDKSDESEKNDSEETVNKERSAHLNSNATHEVSGALAQSTTIEQPTTSYKSNQKTKTTLASDIMSHFKMQPRIILQPIMTACKNRSLEPGVYDLKAGCPENKQTSVRVDDEIVEVVEDENELEKCCTETEIVCVTVGSPQRDSEVQHDNIGGSLENNTMIQQKDNCSFHFPGVSEKTTRDQVSPIIIDDEPEQPNERTTADNALPKCGRTKCDWNCDCKNISAMKLTTMPQSSVLPSLFKETSSHTIQKTINSKLVCVVLSDVEDNVDEDVLSPSKRLDEKKTASGLGIQNEQSEVGSTPGKNPSSDSNCPVSDATESTKYTVGASQHIGGQSISNDAVSDQIAFTAIRQTEDRPMSSEEGISCQTSEMVFSGQETLDVNADKKLLDMETVSSGGRKNDKLGLNSQGPECQTISTEDDSNVFKTHHCCYCKQPHHSMMDHLQSVHANEPEVAKALTFDQSSQERKQLLNLLQARGNIMHNTSEIQSSKQDPNLSGRFASDSSFDDSVYCIYCLGLFNKTSFALHLEQCKGKSTHSAGVGCVEMLPNAGLIPPTPTLMSPSGLEEMDANTEPSGFRCLNTLYGADIENEEGCSSLSELSCNKPPDSSRPIEEYRNYRQAEGPFLQFRHSPDYQVAYGMRSANYHNPSTGQESIDRKNEGVTLPKCDGDQERAMTPTSNSSHIGLHPEYHSLRNDDSRDDFSPPQNAQTVCNNTPKSSMKSQTYGTGKKRRKKRHSRVHNQSLDMDDDVLDGRELSNLKAHVCQHCKATFGSPYTLRRHEYTHTGERPFWCHQCNVGFIQKYRLLKHMFACHGDTPDQEKLKRAKRSIQDELTLVKDEASIEPATTSLEDLPNAIIDDTEKNAADTSQDTEVREFHWEEAGHSTVKDYEVDF